MMFDAEDAVCFHYLDVGERGVEVKGVRRYVSMTSKVGHGV